MSGGCVSFTREQGCESGNNHLDAVSYSGMNSSSEVARSERRSLLVANNRPHRRPIPPSRHFAVRSNQSLVDQSHGRAFIWPIMMPARRYLLLNVARAQMGPDKRKPAKLLNSKSLTLCFSRQQIWPVFFVTRPGGQVGQGLERAQPDFQIESSSRGQQNFRGFHQRNSATLAIDHPQRKATIDQSEQLSCDHSVIRGQPVGRAR
jgi:hypothetical protein